MGTAASLDGDKRKVGMRCDLLAASAIRKSAVCKKIYCAGNFAVPPPGAPHPKDYGRTKKFSGALVVFCPAI